MITQLPRRAEVIMFSKCCAMCAGCRDKESYPLHVSNDQMCLILLTFLSAMWPQTMDEMQYIPDGTKNTTPVVD